MIRREQEEAIRINCAILGVIRTQDIITQCLMFDEPIMIGEFGLIGPLAYSERIFKEHGQRPVLICHRDLGSLFLESGIAAAEVKGFDKRFREMLVQSLKYGLIQPVTFTKHVKARIGLDGALSELPEIIRPGGKIYFNNKEVDWRSLEKRRLNALIKEGRVILEVMSRS